MMSFHHEQKFWLEQRLVPALRSTIAPFMCPDHYALDKAGYRYPISSIYFDNPGLDLFHTQQAQGERIRLCIKAYDDQPANPVFFEVKRQNSDSVQKSRHELSRKSAQQILDACEIGEGSKTLCPEFAEVATELGAEPMLRVRYEREAYVTHGNNPVRIALDTDLMYSVTTGPSLRTSASGWSSLPVPGVLLHVKFNDQCPSWISSMLRKLQLQDCEKTTYHIALADAIESRMIEDRSQGKTA